MADHQTNRRFATWQSRLSSAAGLWMWWRHAITEGVDHQAVMTHIVEESGWSPRYAFMILMSGGIAVLGLLLSSPAVVIGAMLISPLMNPILGFGFSLAMFDFREARRSLTALAIGSILAVAFTAWIVLLSPLKEATDEILSRTRPNLFDLLVALFAALAGAFAIIRGRGATIVGVAIATALMPPLAVVGYGLATWNMPVLGGALALFVTNFVTIALSATIMARLYGFGRALSRHQTWLAVDRSRGRFRRSRRSTGHLPWSHRQRSGHRGRSPWISERGVRPPITHHSVVSRLRRSTDRRARRRDCPSIGDQNP